MRRTPILCGLLALALLGAVGQSPGTPRVADTEPPAGGRFLVATEHIRGTIFQHSVVFLLGYGEAGAIGLIVNRPTDIALQEVVEGARADSGTLYVGGPVEPSHVMVLMRSEVEPKGAVRVAEDVFVTVDADALVERTAQGADGLRVYAGYAGWGAGQLEGEIARGDWIVARAPTQSIFEGPPEELWKRLHLANYRLIARAGVAVPRDDR